MKSYKFRFSDPFELTTYDEVVEDLKQLYNVSITKGELVIEQKATHLVLKMDEPSITQDVLQYLDDDYSMMELVPA